MNPGRPSTTTGLLAEAVGNIHRVERSQVKEPPYVNAGSLVVGVVELPDGRLVQTLDLARLVSKTIGARRPVAANQPLLLAAA